jgi:DNA-directed RNA polymerase beta subunit
MNISTDHKYNWEIDTWNVIDAYFRDKKVLVKHQIESYNDFVDNKIQKIINEFNPVKSFTDFNEELGKYMTEFRIEFGDISISKPVINDNDGEVKVMYPQDARLRNLTYSAPLSCTIRQKIIRYNPKNVLEQDITELPLVKNMSLGKIPIMLQSKYCVLSDQTSKTRTEMGEGEYDEGGYFIINGSEKVVVCFEKKCENKIFVFPQSKGPSSTYSHIAEITSIDHKNPAYIKLFSVKLTAKEGNFFGRTIKSQISRVRSEIPVVVLFRALGVISDKDIIETIVYDLDSNLSKEMIDNLRPSLEEASPIRSKKVALEYISKYINNITPKNKDSQSEEHKLKYTEDILLNEILPHVGKNPIKKAYFLGLMIRKLLLNYMGYIQDDDRDSFINKRVESPGALLALLFRSHFNKLVKDLKMAVDKDIKNGRINEVSMNLNKKIKASTIEINMKYALSTGNWGLKNQPNKKGVAQVMNRLSYLSSLSHRRRVIAPIDRSGKQTGPRKLHNTQFGTICCLTGDTKVLLADGITQEEIKNIEGKSVMTINPETLEEEPSRIYNFFKIMPEKLLEIKMMNGRKIKCTDDHPFLVSKDNKYVWIKAGELNVNDKLIVRHCEKETIVNYFIDIETINEVEPEMVYDFTTISKNHSFCANGIWVHNCVETPEGGSIGIVKNLAMMAHITLESDPQPVVECMSELGVIPLEQATHDDIAKCVNVFINGDWVGVHNDPSKFVAKMRNMRRSGMINIFTSIAWNITMNQININTDAGRLCRPLYIVEDNDLLMTDDIIKKLKSKELSWSNLLANLDGGEGIGAIEYIDTEESDCSMIAMTYDNLRKNNPNGEAFYRYTHCEIHPSMMLGVLAANIPFCERNQSPRNLFQSAMGKQAMGVYETSFNKRMDTISHVLHYPQKPLVNTRPSIHVNSNELPSGQNAIVAILCHTGYNQEDSLIMNKSSVERGLFNASTYKTYKDQEKKNQSTLEEEKFCKPEKFNPNGSIKTRGMKQGSYDKLDDDGFIKIGSKIESNDIIIGKVLPLKQTAPNEPKFRDASTSLKDNAEGVVDWVYTYKNDGYKEAKVRIRSERVPEGGDKFACTTEFTEVLSLEGWKSIKDIKITDKVAILDGDNVKYECPLKLHEYDYDGKMYELKSQQVDLTTTPNHRLWIKKRNKDYFEFVNAENAFGKRVRHKKNVNFFVPDDWIGDRFTIPEFKDGNNLLRPKIDVDMNDWLTFFGIFLAEGYVSYGAVAFAVNKQRVKDALEPVINNMGFNLAKSGEKWSIGNVQLANYMVKYSPGAIHKFMPDWVWQLNKEQCKLLLSSMELGDGYTSKSNNRFYYTSSKQLADDVTRLALHAGYSTNVRVPEGRKKGTPYNFKGRDQQGVTNADNYVITIIKTKTEPQINHGHCKKQNGQSEQWIDFKGKVYCLTVRTGIFYIRENGKPVWTGNSRHGQKGTIGILYNQEDMPYTKDGIIPDIIMNPLAIPSRMTIGQLIECILGKSCSLNGYEADATPFTGIDVEDVADILEQTGFERYGTEILYNGRTGEQLKARIFIGPTFYYRLKHLVSDKWHSRSSGPYQLLTKQPAEGRSRAGGLRTGEMEKDALLAHGAAHFLKERLFDSSDKYVFHVCKDCGMIAVANPAKNIYKCTYCDNTSNFAKVFVPYAMKLMWQELMAMGIAPRMLTDTQ